MKNGILRRELLWGVDRFLISFMLVCFLFLTTGVLAQTIEIKPLNPYNSYVGLDTAMSFSWQNSNADFYTLQISSNKQFVAPTSFNCIGTDTIIKLSFNHYYWRVNSTKNFISSSWSEVRDFRLINLDSLGALSLWLKADSGIIYSGSKVSQWSDLSGNNYHLTQGTVSEQPVIDTLSLNNLPAIYFDGNTFLENFTSVDVSSMFTLFFHTNNSSPIITGLRIPNANPRYALVLNSNVVLADGNTPFSPTTTFVNGILSQNSTIDQWNIVSQKRTNPVPKTFISYGLSPDYSLPNKFNGYLAEHIIYGEQLVDSTRNLVEQYLRYKYSPPVNLGVNVYVPYGFCDTVIDAGSRFVDYSWNTGDNSSSVNASNNGQYYVDVIDIFGFSSSDTVNVIYPKTIDNFIADTILCLGDSLTIFSKLNKFGYNFLWSDNSTDSIFTIKTPGSFWVKVTDSLGCFQYSDTINVLIDSFPTQATLGSDKTVCQFENLALEFGDGAISYLWSNGDTIPQTPVDTSGKYWVKVTNSNGCVANDTILITLNGKAPEVGFETLNFCVNEPTTFTDTSITTDGSNIIDWHWDFGDGDTSNIQSPQNKYDTAGVYNVVLQVLTDSGCVNSVQQQITIHKKPTAGFFPANGLICSNQNATFTNNSFSSDGNIDSWYWNFGDVGSLDTSSLENGVYSFSNFGSFNVQLISSTEYGCSDTVSQFISVKQTPTASFLIQDSCDNSPVGFINTSEGNLFSTFWDFGDFNSSTLINPSHTYNTSGVYSAKLIVKDLNGCWDTLVSPITINENPEANFINDDYCVLSTIQLYDSSSTTSGFIDQWEWSILNTDYNSTIQNPQFLFNTSDTGVFNLKLKVANSFGCLDSVTKVISIYPLPVPEFTFSPQIGLPPLEVDFTNNSTGANAYEWDFGDNNTSTSFGPVYTYTDSNIFDIKLTVTSLYGCKDSLINTIKVINPIVDIAVRDVNYKLLPNSDLMIVTVQLANVGVVPIQTLDLILFNSSTGKILEKWSGNILPNTQELVELSSIIEVPRGEIPDVICVEALMPNNSIDADDTNNEFCKSLLKFDLINIYPNPTSNELNMELIYPESNQIEITLFSELGKKVSVLYSGIAEKGLNRYKFILGSYSSGIYFIEAKFNSETIRKKIMIN